MRRNFVDTVLLMTWISVSVRVMVWCVRCCGVRIVVCEVWCGEAWCGEAWSGVVWRTDARGDQAGGKSSSLNSSAAFIVIDAD